MKFFNKRILFLLCGFVAIIGLATIVGLLSYLSSPGFREKVRLRVVREIESETGGKVSLGSLYWNVWNRRISLFDLTIRGTEPVDGAPLVYIESIEGGVSIRSLYERHIDLFELTITRPKVRLLVDDKGNTNLPTPPRHDTTGRADFQVSIESLKVAQGSATVNERQIGLDFTLKNLNSALSYEGITRTLRAQVSYDGAVERANQPPIEYSLSSNFDFTQNRLLAKRIVVTSGKSRLQLQGNINDVLTGDIFGKLDYEGSAIVPFLNYFLPDETFAGTANLKGTLEFSKQAFDVRGSAGADRIAFDRWSAGSLRANYAYRYPERKLIVDRFSASVFGGSTKGKMTVEDLPGSPRVTLDASYADLDGVGMAREFPWDPMYRVESRISGKIQGTFEGRFKNFLFNGNADLASAPLRADVGLVSLPVDGRLLFVIRPGNATLTNGNFHFLSTSLLADGTIDSNSFNLKAQLASSDLKNLNFIYADANGTGSFDGVLNGPIKTPRAEGTFDLRQHRYRDWTIEQATGIAQLDTAAKTATLTSVRVVQGQSQITLSGTTTFDGAKVDIRAQSAQIRAEDSAPFVKQRIGGVFSGALHLTSLNPLRFDGDVRALGLAYQGQTVRDVQSHVQYDDPSLILQNLSIADGGSTLTGRATFNTSTEALTYAVRISSVDLKRLREFGMPDEIEGRVQQADLNGSGKRTNLAVNGKVRMLDLAFHGETFPSALVDIATLGPEMTLTLSETRNLDLVAKIDTARQGHPFNAKASFRSYSIERLAGFTRGTLTVSGDVELKGKLSDIAHVEGEGRVNPVEIVIQDQKLQSTRPFGIEFNAERLKLKDDVVLASSKGTQMNMTGTVALTAGAKLDLKLTGQVDAGLLVSDEAWNVAGTVSLQGQIAGTLAMPDLQGRASFADLSLSRRGVSNAVTALKGDAVFDEHRMTLNNVEGRFSGGTIQLRGSGTIEGDSIGSLNFRVDAKSVRVRYPAGMRSNVDAALTVGGTMKAPTVNGELQIQSLSFNSSFDEFLALFEEGTGIQAGSPFGNTQLSLRVIGSRNISIENELASAKARIDLGIKGTVDKPALTGSVETNSGTLHFQGKKYDVTRGNIDFVDPVRIDPAINLQAETSIRNYQVFLSISGRINRLQLSMRSEPPLSQLEIVNLISGGRTTDEFGQSTKASVTPTGEQVFQGGAASILSDMLVSRVGSKFNLLGLDRIVRIDPFVVGAQNSTTARITLSQQVTKDLSVTYSQDLASNKQQIIQIEYFITKNISVLASKDEDDVRALDLRIRKRF